MPLAMRFVTWSSKYSIITKFFSQRPLTTFLPDGKTSIQLHDPSVITSEEDTFLHLSAPGMAFYHKPSNAVLVRCADHSLLSVKALKQESMKLVPARDFWNGMRGRPAWLGEVEHDGRKLNFVQFRGPAV
jgi:methionyl-tRNA formyltransferase